MLPVLILALTALGAALLRLWSYRAQMLEMARILEETPAERRRMRSPFPPLLEEERLRLSRGGPGRERR